MKKKIRVLHVAEAAGGVERYLQNLFKFNDNSKVENIIITSGKYEPDAFYGLVSKQIFVPMKHEISAKDDIKSIRLIRKHIKQLKPDIVYAHSSKAGALTRIANIGLKNKLIYNPHGWAFNMDQAQKKKQLYKMVEKMLAPLSDKIICISQAEINSALENEICKTDKLELIYNGIDIETVEKTKALRRKDLGIPEDAFVVGQVGRLSKQKAPDVFVKAAVEIKKKIPNAFFLLVGDGELRDDVNQLIKKNNLESSFLITGWVNNPIKYMKIMNVGTLLSRWEGFGLVLPEYMISKVPVVASRVDAIPEIVRDGETGYLVESNNFEIVAKKIFDIYSEPKKRDAFVQNAYQFAKVKFDAKRVFEQSLDLYKNKAVRKDMTSTC